MQNTGLYICGRDGKRVLSQSVKISAIPIMSATSEHPPASPCDSSYYRSAGAELYFWEIGHLRRGTTSKQHWSTAQKTAPYIFFRVPLFCISRLVKSGSFHDRLQRLIKAQSTTAEMKIFYIPVWTKSKFQLIFFFYQMVSHLGLWKNSWRLIDSWLELWM